MVERAELERECSTFSRYLCGAEAGEYVRSKYVAAHEAGVVELASTTRFEHEVARIAGRSPALARALDSYSRVFGNGNLLRRKLVLVLALLESKSPPAEEIDAPTPGSNLGMFARMAWLGAAFAARVVVTAIALLPVRVACALRGER
jgi:hypothetical protein